MAISHAVLAAVIAVYGGNPGEQFRNKAAGNVSLFSHDEYMQHGEQRATELTLTGSCIHDLLVHR